MFIVPVAKDLKLRQERHLRLWMSPLRAGGFSSHDSINIMPSGAEETIMAFQNRRCIIQPS